MLESAQQEPAETLGEIRVRSGLKLSPLGRGHLMVPGSVWVCAMHLLGFRSSF